MPLRIKISVNDAKPIHPPNWMLARISGARQNANLTAVCRNRYTR
jgi:hypothetical protein